MNNTPVDKGKLSLIEDLILNMVRAEPSLYDKGDERYHREYKDRSTKFEVISQAIFHMYGEVWSGKLQSLYLYKNIFLQSNVSFTIYLQNNIVYRKTG